jgi:predicted permease
MPAFRFLCRNPAFFVAATGLLGLGIGASTLIFTLVNALLLRPLLVTRPDRLAQLGVESAVTHVSFDVSGAYARVVADQGRSFDRVFTFYPLDASLAIGKRVETVTCEVVSDNYFEALGVGFERGAFVDNRSKELLPAVLSEELWRRTFGAREDAVGSGIRLRGAAFTISGVARKGFGGLDLDRRAHVWVPQKAWQAWTGSPNWRNAPACVFVRLRDGVETRQAEAEVRALYPAMVEADLEGVPGITAGDISQAKRRTAVLKVATQGISALRKQFSAALTALLGAIAVLLLLIAANVGGLMLARGEVRRRELAVRMSLGASRANIAWAALSESFWPAAGGALLGSFIARCCGPLLLAFLPSRRPINLEPASDYRVLAFTIAATAGVALVASLAPAWSAIRTDPVHALGRAARRATAPVFGRAAVIVQVALATLLCAGGVSLVRSLDALRKTDPGFVRDGLVVAVVNPSVAGIRTAEFPRVYEEILRRARELPGAAGASLSAWPLMRGMGYKNTVARAGTRITPADRLNVSLNFVSESHLANLGMRLIAGRNVVPLDAKTHPSPAVVTESFARRFFPGVDPLGREFGRAGPDGMARPDYRIVGVAADVNYRGMRDIAPPTIFQAFGGDEEIVTLYVRSRGLETEMSRRIRAMLAAIGPGLAPVEMATMRQDIEISLWRERLIAAIARAFAVLAALVAGIGLFALMAFTLSSRTREVGIRMAVGATPARIAVLFACYGFSAVFPGVLIGFGGYLLVWRELGPLLFGQGAAPGAALAAGGLALLLVSASAVAIPLMRAVRLRPAEALREE